MISTAGSVININKELMAKVWCGVICHSLGAVMHCIILLTALDTWLPGSFDLILRCNHLVQGHQHAASALVCIFAVFLDKALTHAYYWAYIGNVWQGGKQQSLVSRRDLRSSACYGPICIHMKWILHEGTTGRQKTVWHYSSTIAMHMAYARSLCLLQGHGVGNTFTGYIILYWSRIARTKV